MSHMAKAPKYDARAELRKIIRYFEKGVEAWKLDNSMPYPTIKGAIADGVTAAAKGTVHNWCRQYPDLYEKIRELIESGPHADSGKGQTTPPPGISPAKAEEIKQSEAARDRALSHFSPKVEAALDRFFEKFDPEEEWHVREAVKVQGNLAKGWKKDVDGRLDHTHKHNHFHQIADELAAMTPEQIEEFERESMRDINGFDEQEKKVKSLQPAGTKIVDVEARSVERAG